MALDPNLARLRPYFFFWGGGGGGPPKFWNVDYKMEEPSDHAATFRGERPTELGDLALKKPRKKHHQ